MRDTSERVAGTAKGNHQLRWRRTEEGGTRHGETAENHDCTHLYTQSQWVRPAPGRAGWDGRDCTARS